MPGLNAPKRHSRGTYASRGSMRTARPLPSSRTNRRIVRWHNGETQLKRALTQGAGIVSNLSRSKRGSALACSRCGAAMDEVVRIEPLAGEPGLIAYECPSCGYVTSLFSQPDGGH